MTIFYQELLLKIKSYHIAFYFLISLFFISCGEDSNKNNDDDSLFNVPDSLYNEDDLITNETGTAHIIYNISSPIEMASLIKSKGVAFSINYLSPIDNQENYNTEFKKSFALGVLSADLGYLNIYNKTSSVLSYISLITELADDIKVGQFFDFNTLKRLAVNNKNLDSLVKISVSNFNKMDEHLQKNGRGRLSALLVSGVWLEGVYLATQVVDEIKSEEIEQRIGEQKIVLNELIGILEYYMKDDKIKELMKDFKILAKEFDKVKITYEIGEPETIEENGMYIVIQNERSIIDIPEGQLEKIISKTKKIRNKLIGLK